MKLPALTIWQPWTSLIMAGCKAYEFRTWRAPRHLWGKRIAILAAARPGTSIAFPGRPELSPPPLLYSRCRWMIVDLSLDTRRRACKPQVEAID
jgi:hypothetical protein